MGYEVVRDLSTEEIEIGTPLEKIASQIPFGQDDVHRFHPARGGGGIIASV